LTHHALESRLTRPYLLLSVPSVPGCSHDLSREKNRPKAVPPDWAEPQRFGKVKLMHRKTILYGLIALMVLAGTTAPTAWALRCGTRIVSEGDSKDKVEYACGAPHRVDSWEEERIVHEPHYEPFWNGERYERRVYYRPVRVWVKVDKWTYNHGSTRFLRHLFFKNGVLKKIDIGEKGY
jgi:hypothetical protein